MHRDTLQRKIFPNLRQACHPPLSTYGRGHNLPPSLQAAAWAYGEKEQDFPIAADLASHIIGSLMEQEFDVAYSCQLPPNEGMGHAFSGQNGCERPPQPRGG